MRAVNWPAVASEFLVWVDEKTREYSAREGITPPLRYLYHVRRQLAEHGGTRAIDHPEAARALIFWGIARHHDAGAMHPETRALRRDIAAMLHESVARHTGVTADEAAHLVLRGATPYVVDPSTGDRLCVLRKAGAWCRVSPRGVVERVQGLDTGRLYRLAVS